jgi:hypothetical protein
LFSYDRLWADFYEGDETSHTQLGNASRGIHVARARMWSMLDMDRTLYAPGESVIVTVKTRNDNDVSIDYTADVFLQDPYGTILAVENFSGTADAQSLESRNFTFTLPEDAALGTYIVGFKIYHQGLVIGGNTYSFSVKHLFNARLTLDKNAYAARGTMQVTAAMKKPSTIPWEGDVQLEIPAIGYLAMDHVSLAAGGSRDLVFDDILIPKISLKALIVYISVFRGILRDGQDVLHPSVQTFRAPSITPRCTLGNRSPCGSRTAAASNLGGVPHPAGGGHDFRSPGTVNVWTDQPAYLFMPVDLATPGGAYYVAGYVRTSAPGTLFQHPKSSRSLVLSSVYLWLMAMLMMPVIPSVSVLKTRAWRIPATPARLTSGTAPVP